MATLPSRMLRQKSKVNYKEPKESDISIAIGPGEKVKAKKSKKPKPDKELFQVEVIEEDSSKCRVHYVGYSSAYDEWKEKEEIVSIDDDKDPDDPEPSANDCIIRRFSLYHELGTRIKSALNSNRKGSPLVRIDMPFDSIEFDGGLQRFGTKKRFVKGVQRYSISSYQDLNTLRGININGDFCYIILNTVEFYLYHRRSVKEYVPTEDLKVKECHRDAGDMLVFCFVKGDGTPDQFGIKNDVFVNI